MYGHFKTDLAQVVIDTLSPVQEKYNQLMADKGHLLEIMKINQARAQAKAQTTLRRVYESVGLLPRA